MRFNSIDFLFFFPLVTTLYFALPHHFRWLLLLGASCVFYMYFIPVYLLILFLLITIDYFAARMIAASAEKRTRKRYLIVSILATCTALFIFKYFNFFNTNFSNLAGFLHWNYSVTAYQTLRSISFHPADLVNDFNYMWQQLADQQLKPIFPFFLIGLLIIFSLMEWLLKSKHILPLEALIPKPIRWIFYYAMIGLIIIFGVYETAPNFIYFQF